MPKLLNKPIEKRSGLPIGMVVLLATVTLLFLPRVLLLMQVGTTFIAWTWQFDYTEGVNLSAVNQLASGANIYRHNGPDTFISTPYTPLFFLINVPFSWISGPSFAVGRTISFLSTFAIAALLCYIVWKAVSNDGRWTMDDGTNLYRLSSIVYRPLSGLLPGALWLSLSPVIIWAALYEQNMPALALGLGGIAWTLTVPQDRRVYIGAIFFALAFFTKQSALDSAAATFLWLLIRDWRIGLRFGLVLAAAIGIPFFVTDLLLKGGLWEHTIQNQTYQSWSERRFARTLTRLWTEYWPLMAWGGAGVMGTLICMASRWRIEARERLAPLRGAWGLAVLYSILGSASVLARIGREGINYNHLLDVLLPLCLLVGLSAGMLLKRLEKPDTGRAVTTAGVGLMLTLILIQALLLGDIKEWYRGAWPAPDIDREMQNISAVVARTPGDIYSEDAYLLISNRRQPLFDDAFMFAALTSRKAWDDTLFIQSIRDRRFSIVLLQHGSTRWTDEEAAVFEDNYKLESASILDTFTPKQVPTTPQHSLACALTGGGDAMLLDGYSLNPGIAWNGIKPGEALRVTLYWRTERMPQQSYASYVQLLNKDGERVAAQDNPQTGANQPTTAWKPGTTITDTAAIPLPNTLLAGKYRLLAGMYKMDGGVIKGLPSICQKGETYGEAVLLGWVEVK